MVRDAEKLLIIGGSDAGISAALKAKELKPQLRVQVLLADEYLIYQFVDCPMQLVGRYPIGIH